MNSVQQELLHHGFPEIFLIFREKSSAASIWIDALDIYACEYEWSVCYIHLGIKSRTIFFHVFWVIVIYSNDEISRRLPMLERENDLSFYE